MSHRINPPKPSTVLVLAGFLCSILLSSCSAFAAPILQPGAPGETTRLLDAETAVSIANSSYTLDDVRFIQDMIFHHHQATLMAKLADSNTNNKEIVDLAKRIDTSQADEIIFMQEWLEERSEVAPNPFTEQSHNTHHGMAGMATPEQMTSLGNSTGKEFDRLFLNLMIAHHDGAIEMVEDLREQPGSAFDSILDEFASDIVNDQAVEIERMNVLLIGLSNDPRAGLAAGLYDAEEAILHLQLVESQRKPQGFFDPENPAGQGAEKEEEDKEKALKESKTIEEKAENKRYPMLSFANTDMAFRDDILVTGSYHGFNIYRINNEGLPRLLSSVVCPGGQGDVSVVGDLLIYSVEQSRSRIDCGLEGVNSDASPDRFQGLRIFDISDLSLPKQVGAVQTCRGSHTHSVVSHPSSKGKILVYNSGIRDVREEKELEGCIDDVPGDQRTALFRIDVIEIPLDNPAKSRVIDSPAVFADSETGMLAGLWRGGDHGDDSQETYITDHCHDITVFPSANIAAGACSGNGILFDITDPRNPSRLDVVTDNGFAYWHSATFNNEGNKVLFTDEWGGGGRARCRAWDPLNWGADAIYDLIDGGLEFKSHYKMPAPQLETENCVAHNGSIIPVPGRDIFVQAWYQGGISVVDFTDSSNPQEIAYFDRGPIMEDELVTGGYWSVYYYEGFVYATEITRGLDVLKLMPSEYLSQNEIAAAALAYPLIGPHRSFNPQQQMPMTWPEKPEVALAYIDQLTRSGDIDITIAANISRKLDRVNPALQKGGDRRLAEQISALQKSIEDPITGKIAQRRTQKLKNILAGITKALM